MGYKDHKIIEISDSDQSFIENQDKIKEINEELKNPEKLSETMKNYDNEVINNLNNELLCCICGEIPEILNVHTDNCKIELKCKNCGIYEILIDEYYDELSKIHFFRKCKICNKSDNNTLCENFKNKFIIELDKKEDFCPKHSEQFKYFCNDCHENFCEKEKEKVHKMHEIIEIDPKDEKYEEYYSNIKKINEEIKRIIEFNKLVLNIGERFKNNYFHIKIYIIPQKLSKNNKYIYLNKRELDDEDFKYISHKSFNQLIEIDISENNLTNVEPFNKMCLPFLEFLNLGHNKIKKIEPIAKLKSKNLQYIFLQNNQIEDIETFLVSEFPSLKILRVEDNNIIKENEQDKDIIKKIKDIDRKYPGKFIYISINKQIKEFNKKFKLAILKIDKDNIKEIPWLKENEREEFILRSTDDNKMIESEFEGDIENIVDIVLPDLDMGDEMLKYFFSNSYL